MGTSENKIVQFIAAVFILPLLLLSILITGQRVVDDALWETYATKKVWNFADYIGFVCSPWLWVRYLKKR